MSEKDRPLVTFALFAYNQEQFIREAVESALSQAYDPLEIIISDDCSNDKTFQIIKDMISSYNGSHEIILNRNEKNFGFANHINYVMKLAKGELIVFSAGDDISHTNRTIELYKLWNENKRQGVVYSNVTTINKNSEIIKIGDHKDFSSITLQEFINHPIALKCSYAISKRLWKAFPEFRSDLLNEDFIFPFRSLYIRENIKYTEKCLVKYRIGVGESANNLVPIKSRKYYAHQYSGLSAVWNQIIDDIKAYDNSNYFLRLATSRQILFSQMKEYCCASKKDMIKLLWIMKLDWREKLKFVLRVNFPKIHWIMVKILGNFLIKNKRYI